MTIGLACNVGNEKPNRGQWSTAEIIDSKPQDTGKGPVANTKGGVTQAETRSTARRLVRRIWNQGEHFHGEGFATYEREEEKIHLSVLLSSP